MKWFVLLFFVFSCSQSQGQKGLAKGPTGESEIATFAGGCFWCTEADLEKASGVLKVISGFSGGELKNPSYKKVASGQTKHREAVQVTYNPKLISYKQLLEYFWRNINPTDNQGQFVDRGFQYSPAIFVHNENQKEQVLASLEELKKKKLYEGKVNIPIIAYKNFYPAEDYHQDYYKKNPIRYKLYRYRSGRDQFLKSVWKEKLKYQHTGASKKWDKAELKKRLTPMQYKVTQEDGTEPPFKNKYWNNKAKGIYVDIVSGEPLFSSKDKYESKTGWPSFTRPIEKASIVEKEDNTLFMKRVEVRSKMANSHLGHVFKDGPPPTGLRYCINSAALEFIPLSEMKRRGYQRLLYLFEK